MDLDHVIAGVQSLAVSERYRADAIHNLRAPELEERMRAARPLDADRLAAWIDDRLKAYGPDPRDLTKGGVAEHLRGGRLPPDQERLLRQLFFLA